MRGKNLLRIAQATSSLTKLDNINKDCTGYFISYKAEADEKSLQNVSSSKGKIEMTPCHFHIAEACDCGPLIKELEKKSTALWEELLPKDTKQFVQGSGNTLNGLQKELSSHCRM